MVTAARCRRALQRVGGVDRKGAEEHRQCWRCSDAYVRAMQPARTPSVEFAPRMGAHPQRAQRHSPSQSAHGRHKHLGYVARAAQDDPAVQQPAVLVETRHVVRTRHGLHGHCSDAAAARAAAGAAAAESPGEQWGTPLHVQQGSDHATPDCSHLPSASALPSSRAGSSVGWRYSSRPTTCARGAETNTVVWRVRKLHTFGWMSGTTRCPRAAAADCSPSCHNNHTCPCTLDRVPRQTPIHRSHLQARLHQPHTR